MPEFVVDLEGRLDFFGLARNATQQRKEILRAFELHIPDVMRAFYRKVAQTPHAARYFSDSEAMEHASDKQLDHWRSLFSSNLDDEFVRRAKRVGTVHARIGLDPSLYFGAYSQVLTALVSRIVAECASRESCGPIDLADTISTLIKVALLDMDIAIGTIFSSRDRDRADVITKVGAALRAVANGDIAREIDPLPTGYAGMSEDFNGAVKTIGNVLLSVTHSAHDIGIKTEALDEALQALADRTGQHHFARGNVQQHWPAGAGGQGDRRERGARQRSGRTHQ